MNQRGYYVVSSCEEDVWETIFGWIDGQCCLWDFINRKYLECSCFLKKKGFLTRFGQDAIFLIDKGNYF